MFLSTLQRGGVLVGGVLIATMAANANVVVPRGALQRPAMPRGVVTRNAVRRNATTPGNEQVLGEGGTLAANFFGNLADIVGQPIPCNTPMTGFDRDCKNESNVPDQSSLALQDLYAAVGTGGAQLDFVDQQSGKAGKTAAGAPVASDSFDAYSGTAGFTGYAGTTTDSNTEDTIDFAAGDAPIPLGPSQGAGFVSKSFTVYADSLASYNGGGDRTGGSFNANRGPARVEPVVGTGISIIFNTTGLTVPDSGLDLSQDTLCGIFTGFITNWNQVPGDPTHGGSQSIRIDYRADGSGSTFLTAYNLSQMCGPNNPFHGTGAVTSAHYWGQTGHTTGVGTDSKILSTTGAIPPDSNSPETVWPNNAQGSTKTGGVLAEVAAVPGLIGYVSPSSTLGKNTAEAYIENYAGNYYQANTTSVSASLASTTSSDRNPPGYPEDNRLSVLYFPFPTASTGDALVGYSYAYFYTCYPERIADQALGVKQLFGYIPRSTTKETAATIAQFWNLAPLNSTELTLLQDAVGAIKTAPVTTPTNYVSPVDGSTKQYTCTDN